MPDGETIDILCGNQKKAKTDWIYIHDTLKRFYNIDANVKLSQVFMKTKNEYNSRRVTKQVCDLARRYPGESYVMMCIDLDDYLADPGKQKENQRIEEFCQNNHYEFVWFSREIEEVYLGRRVPDSEKVTEAEHFRRAGKIEKVSEGVLRKTVPTIKNSNILTVMDKYLAEYQVGRAGTK